MTTSKKKLTLRQRRDRKNRIITFIIVVSVLAIIIIAGIDAENSAENKENDQSSEASNRVVCERATRLIVQNPGTVEVEWFSSYSTKKYGNTWYIYQDFSASNAFGMRSNYTLECKFQGNRLINTRLVPYRG